MTSGFAAVARRAVADTADRLIAAQAYDQLGVVTRSQLLTLGLSDGEISYRIKIGRLHRLYAGGYAVGYLPVSSHTRVMSAVLACGPDAALSHGSAATLWGLGKEWAVPLEVTAPSRQRHPGIRAHHSKTLARCEITTHFGIAVTTPARTVLDNATRLTARQLAGAVNDLRLARYLHLAELSDVVDRHAPTRSTKRLREHLAHPERPPTRSEFERAFIIFAKRHGLPEPLVNTDVLGHEADIFFPDHRLVVELDGYDTTARERSSSQTATATPTSWSGASPPCASPGTG